MFLVIGLYSKDVILFQSPPGLDIIPSFTILSISSGVELGFPIIFSQVV
jgi:hypothetical protein